MKHIRVELKNGSILYWSLRDNPRQDILETQVKRMIETGKYHDDAFTIYTRSSKDSQRFLVVNIPKDEVHKLSIVESLNEETDDEANRRINLEIAEAHSHPPSYIEDEEEIAP